MRKGAADAAALRGRAVTAALRCRQQRSWSAVGGTSATGDPISEAPGTIGIWYCLDAASQTCIQRKCWQASSMYGK